MKYKDYYKILGVDKSARQDEIKKAYRYKSSSWDTSWKAIKS